MNAWEQNYQKRGPLWQGTAIGIPFFPPGTRVLEAGCGNGKTLATLSQQGCRVTGCDIASSALRLACQAVPGAHLVQADVRRLPFPDHTYGAVIAVHVTGALREPERRQAAGEYARVLAPGGTLFFREFSVDDFRCGKGEHVEAQSFLRGDGVMTHYFSEDEVHDLFPAERWQGTVLPERWEMRVRGIRYPREVFSGMFCRKRE